MVAFYGWVARRRRPSPRGIEEVWLTEQVERIHTDSGEAYGSPKVHAQLGREGIRVSRKRVERLVRQAGLQGAFMRTRKRSSTCRDPCATPAPDLVNRDCKTDAPDRLWVADITAYRAREEAELDLVRWIDGWYKPRRIQRELGWLSPDEYEEAYYRRQSCGTQASPAGAR